MFKQIAEIPADVVLNRKFLLKEIDPVANIAKFFGFTPIKTPEISKDDLKHATHFSSEKLISKTHDFAPAPEEKIALLRTYLENNFFTLPHPLMLYYKKPMVNSPKKRSGVFECSLDIIGTSNSVAEALAIKTLLAILSEQKFNSFVVEINTTGDKESTMRFERELNSFIKKNWSDIPTDLKVAIKKNQTELLTSEDERLAELRSRAPKPMGYLSDASILHFKEVLEYLETMEISYRINEYLIGESSFCSQTIFRIFGTHDSIKEKENSETLLAYGSRHNYISKKIGFKKDVSLMSTSIFFKKPEVVKKIIIKESRAPKFYFVQLGFRARLKSLVLIDSLRKAKIPVGHSLMKDKFLNQISATETKKPSYLIIMGQKEAIDDTVVIRNVETRAQDTVSVCNLCTYLQSLSKSR
jgi:histidyl-tRNA synthetase